MILVAASLVGALLCDLFGLGQSLGVSFFLGSLLGVGCFLGLAVLLRFVVFRKAVPWWLAIITNVGAFFGWGYILHLLDKDADFRPTSLLLIISIALSYRIQRLEKHKAEITTQEDAKAEESHIERSNEASALSPDVRPDETMRPAPQWVKNEPRERIEPAPPPQEFSHKLERFLPRRCNLRTIVWAILLLVAVLSLTFPFYNQSIIIVGTDRIVNRLQYGPRFFMLTPPAIPPVIGSSGVPTDEKALVLFNYLKQFYPSAFDQFNASATVKTLPAPVDGQVDPVTLDKVPTPQAPAAAPAYEPLMPQEQMERMFGGLDKMRDALPPEQQCRLDDMLTTSSDPDADKAMMANVAFLADSYRKPPEDIASNLDAYRAAYAKKMRWGDTGMDDKEFYNRICQQLNPRLFLNNLLVQLNIYRKAKKAAGETLFVPGPMSIYAGATLRQEWKLDWSRIIQRFLWLSSVAIGVTWIGFAITARRAHRAANR